MVLGGRRIAVTGATGLVGRHLLPLLTATGHTWVGQTRKSPTAPPPPGCGWCQADFASWWDGGQLDALFGDVDGVIHLAAALPDVADPARMMDVNVRACLAIGEWALARGLPLVHVSSSVVYGTTDARCTEAMVRAAVPLGGLYGLTKSLAESVFEMLMGRGLQAAILRPSSLYGYGLASDKLVPRFLAMAERSETIRLLPPAEDATNFIHAADLARACVATLGGPSGIYNVAGPAMVSMSDLARACVAVAGRGAVEIEDSPAPRKAYRRFDLDAGAIARAVGFTPGLGMEAGLRMMAAKSVTLSAAPR